MQVEYISILVAGVASFLGGWFWYSPFLFGKQWMKLMNISPKDVQKAKKKGSQENKNMMMSMAAGFIATLITAYVLSMFIGLSTDMMDGLSLGFYAWLGFIAPVMLGMVLWERKPFALYAINVGWQLVSVLLMSAIIVFI